MKNLKALVGKPASAILENVFAILIADREHGRPDWSWDVWLKTRDDVSIYSWWYDNNRNNHNGTLFILHGFTRNSGKPEYWYKPKDLADKFGFCIGEIDFRFHGKSQNKALSFGLAESWDVEAALNYADSINAPRPYIIISESYGGMAAQYTAISDSRIKAVVCLQTPGWPWDAIGNAFKIKGLPAVVPLSSLINTVYGFDILKYGDIRTQPSNPGHKPYVLYVMGRNDKYRIEHTKLIWDYWYSGYPAEYNKWPADAPNQNKWFIEGPWCHSDEDFEQSVFGWDGLDSLIMQFIGHVLNR